MDKLSHAGTRSSHKGNRPQSAALRQAIRWPRFASRSTADVGFQIRANRPCQCIRCGWKAPILKFGRFLTDRAGMTIIECQCPDCGQGWTRIEA